MRAPFIVSLAVVALSAIAASGAFAQARPDADALSARVAVLEAREAIRTLWAEYGPHDEKLEITWGPADRFGR